MSRNIGYFVVLDLIEDGNGFVTLKSIRSTKTDKFAYMNITMSKSMYQRYKDVILKHRQTLFPFVVKAKVSKRWTSGINNVRRYNIEIAVLMPDRVVKLVSPLLTSDFVHRLPLESSVSMNDSCSNGG